MTTTTKTYTDNYYDSSTYKKTWTVNYIFDDITASGSTFNFVTPTITAKFVGTSGVYRRTEVTTDFRDSTSGFAIGGKLVDSRTQSSDTGWCWAVPDTDIETDTVKGTSGTVFTITKRTTYYGHDYLPHTYTLNTSNYFKSSNKTERTLNVIGYFHPVLVTNTKSNGSGYDSCYDNDVTITVGTVTLNAPPTFDVSPLGKDTAGYYKDDTVVSITVSNAVAQYGGDISSVVFSVGEQSTGSPSATTFYLRLNATGTFTPKVTVTDSRGQVTEQSLPAITVTNAPPSCTATVTSSSPYIRAYTPYTVSITNATASGGTVSSIVLNVGGQTASRTDNGTLSITPTTNGTFTPTVTITDSNGLSTTYTLTSITVQDPSPPTFTATVTSSGSYVRTLSTYSVSITNATASYGGSIASSSMTIGSQTETGSGNGTLSIIPNTAGTFTPTVSVTDNRGFTTTKSMTAITVLDYNDPSMSLTAIRCDSSGLPADEGTYARLTAQITYSDARCNLTKPTLTVTNQSGTAVSTTQTWYTTLTSSGLSNTVSWTNYNPTSPVTLYCLVSGSFGVQAYNISGYIKDSVNGKSATVSQTIPQTFYTIDIQAGGKEIAFGAPANDSLISHQNGLFKCAMDAQFEQGVNIASGKNYKINGTNLSASDVGAVPTSRTVNSKALSSNISLTASDVGAVPTSRTVNSKALLSDITLTASDVSAVALSDKYTRSSAGDIEWTNQTDGDAKVMAKSGVAYWNGAYNGSSSNLKYSVNGEILGKTIVKDYIIENGSDGIWRYRKWNSGRIECWGEKSWENVACTTSLAGGYRSADQTVALPSGLFPNSIASCQATMKGSSGSGYTLSLIHI